MHVGGSEPAQILTEEEMVKIMADPDEMMKGDLDTLRAAEAVQALQTPTPFAEDPNHDSRLTSIVLTLEVQHYKQMHDGTVTPWARMTSMVPRIALGIKR